MCHCHAIPLCHVPYALICKINNIPASQRPHIGRILPIKYYFLHPKEELSPPDWLTSRGSSPNERGHVLIISHSEKEVPLLELVDEVKPEGVGRKADYFPQGKEDVETPSSMCTGPGQSS